MVSPLDGLSFDQGEEARDPGGNAHADNLRGKNTLLPRLRHLRREPEQLEGGELNGGEEEAESEDSPYISHTIESLNAPAPSGDELSPSRYKTILKMPHFADLNKDEDYYAAYRAWITRSFQLTMKGLKIDSVKFQVKEGNDWSTMKRTGSCRDELLQWEAETRDMRFFLKTTSANKMELSQLQKEDDRALIPPPLRNHHKYNQDGILREVRDNVVNDDPVEESSKAQPKKRARNTSEVVLSTLSKVGRKVALKTYDPIRP